MAGRADVGDGHGPEGEPSDLEGCCPFQEAIDLLSRRHAMTILWLLQQSSPRRFNEIRRGLGINPVTLTQRLGELESAGVVSRTTFAETPPRVEYALTPKGWDLMPLLEQMSAWARKHTAPPRRLAAA